MKFKRFLNTSVFFSKELGVFTTVVCICTLLVSLTLTYLIYTSYQSENQRQLALEANRISNAITEAFEEISHLSIYLGKEIATHGKEDLKFIAEVLTNNNTFIAKNSAVGSWPIFTWVNTKNFQVINHYGINTKPLDMSHRTYTIKCRRFPWSLQVSKPAIGSSSGLWIVPVGLGISTQNGKHLGILTTGLEVAKINSKMQQLINSIKTSFIVIDEDLRIIFQSADNTIDPTSSYYRDLLKDTRLFSLPDGVLKEPIVYKDIIYSFYKRMPKYPYIILTGFDKKVLAQELTSIVIPSLLEVWGMGLFCVVLLYFVRRRILRITASSERAKKAFLLQINQEMHLPITTILTYSEFLINYFKGNIKVMVNKNQHIEFVNNIYEAASNLYSLTAPCLNLTFFNANEVIMECINIHSHSALIRDMSIKPILADDLPLLYADELRFKQIITGLIDLGLEFTPQGGIIKITSFCDTIDEQNSLIIMMEDNGFGLSAEDIQRITNKFDTKTLNKWTGLEFSSIEKLVKMHQGTCQLASQWPYGKKITLTFPFRKENEIEAFSNLSCLWNREANIYPFPKKKK